MTTLDKIKPPDMRKETDSLGKVEVPAQVLWGAQTQRSLEHFSIGQDLIPREMITAYATLKKAAASVNHAAGSLPDQPHRLIVQTCDEILNGLHKDNFPLHVWMTGSGTQFNMNVNEVIAKRCSQLAGTPLGSKTPVHPNGHVNMSKSSNDTFPTAMNIAAAVHVTRRLEPAVTALRNAIVDKCSAWANIVKIGRTHMQDATPLTLGQEWSGYAAMLSDCTDRISICLARSILRTFFLCWRSGKAIWPWKSIWSARSWNRQRSASPRSGTFIRKCRNRIGKWKWLDNGCRLSGKIPLTAASCNSARSW